MRHFVRLFFPFKSSHTLISRQLYETINGKIFYINLQRRKEKNQEPLNLQNFLIKIHLNNLLKIIYSESKTRSPIHVLTYTNGMH